ncbi:hypothetical protein ACHOLT_05445 [Desulfitobacterium sp. Sab5]|uniref:hypothetical protein n=1 Tax=Desulfitobacterium nosdiversum TaxID=3375356 RepID=UPI003CFA7A62
MKKKKTSRRYIKLGISLLLSTLLIVQGSNGSSLLWAATADSSSPTGTTMTSD